MRYIVAYIIVAKVLLGNLYFLFRF